MTNFKPEGRFTLRASDYLKLDSNVLTGGGTDETALLQEMLDQALVWGALTLIMDGAALVSGLKIHSNTTIRCENQSCGFYLKDGANRSILQTEIQDWRTIQTENISLLGGSWNINCEHQERTDGIPEKWNNMDDPEAGWENAGHVLMGMRFVGVRNMELRGVRLIDQRVFGMMFGNWEHVVMEDIAIELPHNYYAQNQDGVHFFGPGRDLAIRNIRGCSGDDLLALTPDELDGVSSITDVTIDGVYLENADQGIRLLSRNKGTLDRVYIRNVYGTYKSCGFFINPWFGKGAGEQEGNYGAITIENVDLRPTEHKYAAYSTPFLFRLGGRMKSLTLRNIRVSDSADVRPLVEVSHIYGHWSLTGSVVDIGCLTIDGLEVVNRTGTTDPTDYITVDGKVDHLILRNVLIDRTGNPAPDRLLVIRENAQVGRLGMSSVYTTGIAEGLSDPYNKVEEKLS